jgi:hypothetical protein
MGSLDPVTYADHDGYMPVYAGRSVGNGVLAFYEPAISDDDSDARAEAVLPGGRYPVRRVAFGMGGRFYLVSAVARGQSATLTIEDPAAGTQVITRDGRDTGEAVGHCTYQAGTYEWNARKPWERGEEVRCAQCGERGDHLTSDCTSPYVEAGPGSHAAAAGAAASRALADAAFAAARRWSLPEGQYLIIAPSPDDPAAWTWSTWSSDPGRPRPQRTGREEHATPEEALAAASAELGQQGIRFDPGAWQPAASPVPAPAPARKAARAPGSPASRAQPGRPPATRR